MNLRQNLLSHFGLIDNIMNLSDNEQPVMLLLLLIIIFVALFSVKKVRGNIKEAKDEK